MALEVLHRAFVLLGGGAGAEGAQIAALAGLRILLARVEPVLAGFQLADHGGPPSPITRPITRWVALRSIRATNCRGKSFPHWPDRRGSSCAPRIRCAESIHGAGNRRARQPRA